MLRRPLVRQPQFVIFEALPLVVAAAGSGLVESSPVLPVIDVRVRVGLMCQRRPEATDFVAGSAGAAPGPTLTR